MADNYDMKPTGRKPMAKNKSGGSMDTRMNLGEVGNYGSSNHGRPGKLQDSHEKLGGPRARIHTGDPSELGDKNDGRTE
jgi:hypothetical protein